MDNEDMIVPEADNQPTPEPQAPAEPTQPQAPTEPEGALLDNDEPAVNDEIPEAPAVPPVKSGSEEDGEKSDAGDETPSALAAPERSAPPEPAPTVTDPGTEFTPKVDYSFDIELADGTKVHITKPEDIENLPETADFGTPANLMKAQAKLNSMTTGLENEKRQYEADKQKFDEQQTKTAELQQSVTTMIAEMDYLETKGKLPKVDPQYQNADWNDPEVQKQPGVKERMELLTYRQAENEQRARLGLPRMSVLEAQMGMAQYQQVQVDKEVKDKQAAHRKAKGAMVGGSAPSAPQSIPDDLIVGEGGRISDLNAAY